MKSLSRNYPRWKSITTNHDEKQKTVKHVENVCTYRRYGEHKRCRSSAAALKRCRTRYPGRSRRRTGRRSAAPTGGINTGLTLSAVLKPWRRVTGAWQLYRTEINRPLKLRCYYASFARRSKSLAEEGHYRRRNGCHVWRQIASWNRIYPLTVPIYTYIDRSYRSPNGIPNFPWKKHQAHEIF